MESSIIPGGMLIKEGLCFGRYLEHNFHKIAKNISLSWILLATQ
jgi:hypothetical protein